MKNLDSSRQAREIKGKRRMVEFVISHIPSSSNVYYCHFYEELKFIPCTPSNVIALSPQARRRTWKHESLNIVLSSLCNSLFMD